MSEGNCTFEPFWGPVTSNVDWCEQNYKHTGFIAEYYNTISNLPLVCFGLFGMYNNYKAGYDARFIFAHFWVFVVGIGSTMFHMTLLYYYQLLDELPMILASLVFVFALVDMREDSKAPTQKLLLFVLVSYAILTSIVMAMFTSSPLPMNVCYMVVVFFLIFRSLATFIQSEDPNIRRFLTLSLSMYALGTLCWVIEKSMCGQFEFTRYLHAIWHLCAGFATYVFVDWMSYVQASKLLRCPIWKFAAGVIPYIAKSSKAD